MLRTLDAVLIIIISTVSVSHSWAGGQDYLSSVSGLFIICIIYQQDHMEVSSAVIW